MNALMTEERTAVAIVGAGGAGLTLALLLQQLEIPSVLVERRRDVSWIPRARNLNFRTLEVLRSLGLREEVHSAGTHASRIIAKSSLASGTERQLLDPASLQPQAMDRLSPEPFLLYCSQDRLEPVLRAAALHRGCDVRYDTTLSSFKVVDAGVIAVLEEGTTGKSCRLRADYLIGADGAHSQVRRTLGIGTQGYGPLPEYILFVYFRAPIQQLVAGHEADAIQIRNPDVDGMFLLGTKGVGLFMMTYQPSRGESPSDFSPDRCRGLVEKAIGLSDIPVEIVDVVHWQPAESVADRFQMGRVLLVGDAAHTMPAYKGLGLNTAIQSAQNLAWKLAACIHAQAGPDLLATYQTERRPVGRFAAHQSLTGPSAASLPAGAKSSAAPDKDYPIFYPIVGYRYRSRAIGSADASKEEEDVALLDREELTGEPGTRVPHLWLEREGRRVSTLDLLDGRFVLLAGSDGADWIDAARRVGETLRIRLAPLRVGRDADLVDLEGRWESAMGASSAGAVLLRPDGFIAWRGVARTPNPYDVLMEAVARSLCRLTPGPVSTKPPEPVSISEDGGGRE